MTNINQLTASILPCLTPAGNGVYTVKSSENTKKALQKKLYPNKQIGIEKQWETSLQNISLADNKPLVFGICSDSGGGILRGANWGPLCVREKLYENLISVDNVNDIGDIRIIPHLLHDKYLNEETIRSCQAALYGRSNNNYPVSPLSLSQFVLQEIYCSYPKKTVFTIGGDHSISYATVSKYLEAKKRQGKRVAVVHFDAHTDLMSSRLGIDLNFATWAYSILPYLTASSDLIQIGIRSSRHDKNYWENGLGVKQFWNYDVKSLGAINISENILCYFSENNIDEFYISFDIDAIDSKYVKATGTPEPDGLVPDDALAIIESLVSKSVLTGADMVEVAPFTGINHSKNEPESTLNIAAMISATMLQALTGHGRLKGENFFAKKD